MDIEKFREHCLSMKAVTEDFPFDEETLVFRVGGKMFELTNINKLPLSFNLKCDPERAIELREKYENITPGWHMNKIHWNTVLPDDYISDDLVLELADHSYELVFNSLKKADKEKISKS